MNLRYMEIHLLIALSTSAMLYESRVTAFYLYTASGLLLDVLNVSASVAHYLRSQVESGKGFEVDRDTLFRPFALVSRQHITTMTPGKATDASKLVSFYLIRFPTSETSLVDQIG